MWLVLKKIINQSEGAIVSAPMWPTQTWFTTLPQLAIKEPLVISSSHLHLKGMTKPHPLSPKMKLLAVLCSNDIREQQKFRQKQQKYSPQHGGQRQNVNTKGSSRVL